MNSDNDLIQRIKAYGELTQIEEKPLRTYYTCVRYNHAIIKKSESGPLEPGYYSMSPGPWSCMKGWYESYDNTFQGTQFESKVLNYCKFRNTEEALKKDMSN